MRAKHLTRWRCWCITPYMHCCLVGFYLFDPMLNSDMFRNQIYQLPKKRDALRWCKINCWQLRFFLLFFYAEVSVKWYHVCVQSNESLSYQARVFETCSLLLRNAIHLYVMWSPFRNANGIYNNHWGAYFMMLKSIILNYICWTLLLATLVFGFSCW